MELLDTGGYDGLPLHARPRQQDQAGHGDAIGFTPAIHTPGRVTSALPAMLHGCQACLRMMAVMRVLVVEDHATLAGRIAQGLRQAGMAVDAVHDGAAALEAAGQTAYDVIVLDRDLPVVHGDRVCRTLAAVARGSSCSRRPPGCSMTGLTGWNWARTTTCPSRSRSPSSSPGCGRCPAARRPRRSSTRRA